MLKNVKEIHMAESKHTTGAKAHNSVYQIITDRILELLDQGTIAWQKPWTSGGFPKNIVSKKNYQGINLFLLSVMPYSNPYWLTYKQAKKLGGNVRKGERSTMVVFWSSFEKKVLNEVGEQEIKKIPVIKYYRVFNIEQTEGIDLPDTSTETFEHNPIEIAESIINDMPNAPELTNQDSCRAFYRPSADVVNVPEKQYFTQIAKYYSTMFHELAHSTGHQNRLNRKGITEFAFFGTHEYSREELVAEMTASMLCGVTGIENDTIENSAAYIDGWRRKITKDPKLIIQAASQAQKAANFIQGIDSGNGGAK
jgi:antirestriction protein ArdC